MGSVLSWHTICFFINTPFTTYKTFTPKWLSNRFKRLKMQHTILSIPEAANYSAVSRWTIWKYVRSGELKASRTPGGHYRILKADLLAFMREKGMCSMESDTKKILIVDDDLQIQNLLKKMLSKNKRHIETASNGFEAGTKMLQFKPDLVVLDLFMPGIDGFEVCDRIKGSFETSHMKILVITGHDTEEIRTRILSAGADDYMAKPLDMEKLQNDVENLLGHKRNMLNSEEKGFTNEKIRF